jgi:hypothetical protein
MSAAVYAELKTLHKSTELVPETAKWLMYGWEFDLNDPYDVSNEIYHQIQLLDGKVKYIIVQDSSFVNALYSNKMYHDNSLATENKIKKMLGDFENIYIYLEKHTELEFGKKRLYNADEWESKQIDNGLLTMMQEMDFNFKSFVANKVGIGRIIEYIINSY